MSGKKGMERYPSIVKAEIVEKQKNGQSVLSLSKDYGISRYAIQCWCGLRSEFNIRRTAPLRRGRPRKRPITITEELQLENNRLRMENELLCSFLQLTGMAENFLALLRPNVFIGISLRLLMRQDG